LPNGKCRFGYSQQISDQTKIQSHIYLFARDTQETTFVPQNPLLLAYFRCHHRLGIIHSEQSIGYVLKYWSENSDARRIYVQNALYGGHSVTRSDKLLQLGFSLPLNASLAFVDIGVIT
jgi:hypothetical protein